MCRRDVTSLPRGVLLGCVDLIDVRPVADFPDDPWANGPWCWVLERPRLFACPIMWRGGQGLFNVPRAALV